MIGGRKVRSNKGKKRGSYRTRKTHHSIKVSINSTGTRRVSSRKVRSNKGKKRTPYGPRTGKTRSGRKFRGGLIGKYTDKGLQQGVCCEANFPGKGPVKQFMKQCMGPWQQKGDCDCAELVKPEGDGIILPSSCPKPISSP